MLDYKASLAFKCLAECTEVTFCGFAEETVYYRSKVNNRDNCFVGNLSNFCGLFDNSLRLRITYPPCKVYIQV